MNGFIAIKKALHTLRKFLLPLASPSASSTLTQSARWIVHFFGALAIAAGLTYANRALDLAKALHSPWPTLHAYWLPLIFLLLYAFCWLAYGLAWWHWGLERPSGEFSEIDDAWAEATGALVNAAIDIQELPIYLILGRPASGEANLFHAAGLELVLPPTPARLAAPLRICASRDAIYITCAESSLVGQEPHEFAAPQSSPPRPENALAGQAQTLARLKYLCRLLGKQRKPYCPLNGIVLLIPWQALANKTAAAAIAERVHLDVGVVHEALAAGQQGGDAAGEGGGVGRQVAFLHLREVQQRRRGLVDQRGVVQLAPTASRSACAAD